MLYYQQTNILYTFSKASDNIEKSVGLDKYTQLRGLFKNSRLGLLNDCLKSWLKFSELYH